MSILPKHRSPAEMISLLAGNIYCCACKSAAYLLGIGIRLSAILRAKRCKGTGNENGASHGTSCIYQHHIFMQLSIQGARKILYMIEPSASLTSVRELANAKPCTSTLRQIGLRGRRGRISGLGLRPLLQLRVKLRRGKVRAGMCRVRPPDPPHQRQRSRHVTIRPRICSLPCSMPHLIKSSIPRLQK